MKSRHLIGLAAATALIAAALTPATHVTSFAQSVAPPEQQGRPTLRPAPSASDDQEQIRINTEEIRLPIFASDEKGHLDPTLVPDDVLVLEDDVPQQVRSVRRIPANVVLLVDTGGDATGPKGQSKSTALTRLVAQEVVERLPRGDQIAVIQTNDRLETIQGWTDDKAAVWRALESKLIASKRSRLLEGFGLAARTLESRPEGSRHLVLVTDGVASPAEGVTRADAVNRLLAVRTTVHVISYTEYVRQKPVGKNQTPADVNSDIDRERIRAIARAGIDPTMPPGQSRGTFGGGGAGAGIRFDPAMRRARKEYEDKVKQSEQSLRALAAETGGRILLPKSDAEMLAAGSEVARDIGTQYVLAYRPKRPLSESAPGEYRRINVAPRKLGLTLRARHGYVVP